MELETSSFTFETKAADINNGSVLQVRVGAVECPSPHSLQNKLGRVLWGIVYLLLFRTSPRICYGWRRQLLRLFGARIGKNARLHPTVKIWAPWNLTVRDEASIAHDVDCYCVDRIEVCEHATVSQYVILCTASHDITDPNMKLITAPIVIESQAWLCSGAMILPGITIRQGAVVGARAVATRDISEWMVFAGNPAKPIKQRVLIRDVEDDSLT